MTGQPRIVTEISAAFERRKLEAVAERRRRARVELGISTQRHPLAFVDTDQVARWQRQVAAAVNDHRKAVRDVV